MKLKEFGPPGGGARPKFYYVDPPLAIHKADGSLATSCSQNAAGRNAPRDCSCQWLPFTAYGKFFSGMVEQWNCGNYGMAENREAGSFVNSAVKYNIRSI